MYAFGDVEKTIVDKNVSLVDDVWNSDDATMRSSDTCRSWILRMSEQATDEPLMARLKRDTREAHVGLESRINLMDRLLTATDYRKLLEAFYGVFDPIEDSLRPHIAELVKWIPDVEHRMRTAALRRDLNALGNSSPHELPLAVVPSYDSLAEQIGCMYVLEGSTLGGQVISRSVQQLGFTSGHGCEFFYAHGLQTGTMWKGFSNGVEAYSIARPSEQQKVVQSAIQTFQAFDTWMRTRL